MSTNAVLRDARTITTSLRNARRTMEYGVHQADAAVNILSKDGEIIQKTIETHKYDLKNELDSSRKRLNKVKNMQVLEKWTLRFSIVFFSIVVTYIMAKRLRILQLSSIIIRNTFRAFPRKNNYGSLKKIDSTEPADSSATPLILNFTLIDSQDDHDNNQVKHIFDATVEADREAKVVAYIADTYVEASFTSDEYDVNREGEVVHANIVHPEVDKDLSALAYGDNVCLDISCDISSNEVNVRDKDTIQDNEEALVEEALDDS